ncbi:MAG: Do family serine endopeptidase [Gemmatimonadota bacterium]
MTSPASRFKVPGAVAAAFVGGLVFAAGFDLTPFGYAQAGSATVATPVSNALAPAPLVDLSNAFVSISERVSPAVVQIAAERTQSRTERTPQRNRQPGLEDFFQQFDPRQQQPQQSAGSGFIVSADGYVLTNNHVVEGMDRIRVMLSDNREFPARLIGRDDQTDVAVLKIDARSLPVLVLGDDANTRVGEWVLAIGNPLGLDHTVTAGIVSAKGRDQNDVQVLSGQYSISDFIQTDAAINPGNSGGPLVNIRGEVIGINSAIATRTGTYVGYGFAIPITLARDVMDDLIKNGRVRRAVIGVSIGPVTAEMADAAGLSSISGAVVGAYVGDDSPARRAGLMQGDVVVKADGRVVDRVSTLQRIIRSREPGETIEVEVMRFGDRKTFRVRLGEAPTDAAVVAGNSGTDAPPNRGGAPTESMEISKLGATVENVSEAFARSAQLPAGQRGARVVSVDQDGAARGRLAQNDVVTAIINPGPRRDIASASELRQIVDDARSGALLTFLVYNPQVGNSRVVAVRVGGSR